MSVPTTTDQFLEYLTSSNVVDSDRLTPYLNECKQNSKLPDQPKVLANQLVALDRASFFAISLSH